MPRERPPRKRQCLTPSIVDLRKPSCAPPRANCSQHSSRSVAHHQSTWCSSPAKVEGSVFSWIGRKEPAVRGHADARIFPSGHARSAGFRPLVAEDRERPRPVDRPGRSADVLRCGNARPPRRPDTVWGLRGVGGNVRRGARRRPRALRGMGERRVHLVRTGRRGARGRESAGSDRHVQPPSLRDSRPRLRGMHGFRDAGSEPSTSGQAATPPTGAAPYFARTRAQPSTKSAVWRATSSASPPSSQTRNHSRPRAPNDPLVPTGNRPNA